MNLRTWLVMVLDAALLLGCSGDSDRAQQGNEETRRIMGEIFAGIQVALPASADPVAFGAAENRVEIAAALASLASNASALESHAAKQDAQMQFLARNVARDARDVVREYEDGHTARASFLLRQIVENCVVCHTRLPSREDSPLTEGFVDAGALEDLPLAPRATLLIATRQFDEALTTLEELFASNEHPAMLLGPLTDYLVVGIRVKGDFNRIVPVLAEFAQRPDLWEQLRMDVRGWNEALPSLAKRAKGRPNPETARAMVDEARSMNGLLGNQAGLVHLVTASAILERFIDEHDKRDRDLAEAYYLRGIIEARIGRNYWVTAAPFLLERSIRLAPGEPFANEAYALLQQEILMSYEGSDQEDVSPAEAELLEELRGLIDAG